MNCYNQCKITATRMYHSQFSVSKTSTLCYLTSNKALELSSINQERKTGRCVSI
jgi:hypothetical protein